MTPNHLMILADNKYKVQLRQQYWNTPSTKETKILALEAKFQSLEIATRTPTTSPKNRTTRIPLRKSSPRKTSWLG